ncbi:B3 domain-containing transcription repressor VAL2 [Spatholobus suberectus]|nr:B3 domain-containing transcription repressor VAL2 [Spatholobus suberectus]
MDARLLVDGAGKGNLMQLCRIVEASESSRWPQAERDAINSCVGPNRKEGRRFSTVMKPSSHSLAFTTLQNNRPTWETKSMHKSHSLNISLGTSSGNSVLPSASETVEGRLEGNALSSPFHQGQRSLSILSKPLTNGITVNLETNKGMISQERLARPPADGRGKNLLLSRYWPRITDRELEQLSGLKSTIVPLFEKVLSASDAGRIGRLVLPKSCAEAYFPPISESEGLPLQIQDVKGNEWTFQFRFWPNNNSRMYVLEGVTPCIQALQLNAGDTVTFSRIDPGGKFVMGFRRASDSIDTQARLLSILLYTRKRNGEPYLNGYSEHLRLGSATADCLQTENYEMLNNDLLQRPISVSEKRTQNVRPKRLLVHNEDAMELKLTWEEAQDLLCQPPNVKPSIVRIEDQEFEEYEEPPVFGKRTTINAHPSGKCVVWGSYYGQWLFRSLSSPSEERNQKQFAKTPSEELGPKELENIPETSKVAVVVATIGVASIVDVAMRIATVHNSRQDNGEENVTLMQRRCGMDCGGRCLLWLVSKVGQISEITFSDINEQRKAKPILLGLEDLYQGIPDESVNLTFQDLAQVNTSEKRKPTTRTTTTTPSRSLAKLPSLDFTKGLQASTQHHDHHLQGFGHASGHSGHGDSPWGHSGHFSHATGGAQTQSPRCVASGDDRLGYGMSFDDMSVASGRGGRRRRPGIPHSKICAICNTYTYIFRTRCLVCGRVYCRQCVETGMGEMIEGRKCIECLGLRFSQRYIERAGKVGCCSWRYPKTLKQVELKCAEKGPRRSGRYGHSGMANSRSRSPVIPRRTHAIGSNEHSFVMSSSFSPFSPHLNLPL